MLLVLLHRSSVKALEARKTREILQKNWLLHREPGLKPVLGQGVPLL
jgi:hypothetical protein